MTGMLAGVLAGSAVPVLPGAGGDSLPAGSGAAGAADIRQFDQSMARHLAQEADIAPAADFLARVQAQGVRLDQDWTRLRGGIGTMVSGTISLPEVVAWQSRVHDVTLGVEVMGRLVKMPGQWLDQITRGQ